MDRKTKTNNSKIILAAYNRRLLSVAGQWFVGQSSDKLKGCIFVETFVLKTATEKQLPTVMGKLKKRNSGQKEADHLM